MKITFGYEPRLDDETCLPEAMAADDTGSPGGTVIDMFPFCTPQLYFSY
jgi:hypothetical protein